MYTEEVAKELLARTSIVGGDSIRSGRSVTSENAEEMTAVTRELFILRGAAESVNIRVSHLVDRLASVLPNAGNDVAGEKPTAEPMPTCDLGANLRRVSLDLGQTAAYLERTIASLQL